MAEQTELYNERVAQLEASGLSHEEAEKQVQTQVQVPGASEHQTGLAIDMSVEAGQSDELGMQLAAIAPQYGFVLRYPDGKSNITGVNFENWHFRYVGVEKCSVYGQPSASIGRIYSAIEKGWQIRGDSLL